MAAKTAESAATAGTAESTAAAEATRTAATAEATESAAAEGSSPTTAGSATTTPPPAPRRRDPEGRRLAIVSAAAEIIIEPGTALTHRAVAARAGVALGSTTQYFSSLDELREAALQRLADEIDAALAEMAPFVARIETAPEDTAADMHAFLLDTRAVHADLALLTAGTSDPQLRELALRWNHRLIDMLVDAGLDRARALALTTYLDGATMHAALHETPIEQEAITAAIRALVAMPDPAQSTPRFPGAPSGHS